ncbi:hypothetical protein K431DRAFT_224704 [Polychaeton citri CBS 116435]|uniref:Rhodopsin domain-containing protein n=1 Tax=Polychaeton citri CBS 116435 TaxID=1314669 RepID=A0A9P4QA61_9PEZI|nr:hypothetical protein K431DRAFT_224704 [Polychaeton citri CBS 116435]
MADLNTLPPDVNKGPQILIICSIFVGLALFMVIVRIWVRIKITANLGRDDYCAAAAMFVMFVEMMVIIPEVVYGAGRHVQYLDHDTNIKGLHLNFVTQPLCLIALCLAKVSVGLFLLRLAISRNYIRFIWCVIVFTILSTLGNLLTVFFQCQPLSFVWDFTVEGGKCIPQPHLKFAAFFNSSVSVLTDVIFALLPIPLLWKVQLNRKTKAAVVCILSMGLFAVAAGIVKMTFLNDYGKYGDFLFDSSYLTIWYEPHLVRWH